MNKRLRNKYLRLFGYRLEGGEVVSKDVWKSGEREPNLRRNHPEKTRWLQRLVRERERVLPALLLAKEVDEVCKQEFTLMVKYPPTISEVSWVERGGRPRQHLRDIVRRISDCLDRVEGETWPEFISREAVYLSGLVRANPKLIGKRISGVRTRLSDAS